MAEKTKNRKSVSSLKTTLDSIRDIRLYQPKDGYRFSVDSVLLYSFINLRTVRSIVDLGSGSGVVGLLLAKKYRDAHVTLIELQENLYRLSKRNIKLNGLEERVSALREDIRKLNADLGQFGLVVSNPPFRRPLTGRLSIDEERAVARHELEMTLPDLLQTASMLLKHRGRCAIIYHPLRLADLVTGMRNVKLEPKRMRFVHGKRNAEAKMVLVETVKGGREGMKVERPLFVYNDDGTYSNELLAMFKTKGYHGYHEKF